VGQGQGHPDLPIKLVVGLGNIGGEYEATRHNAGFWFVDELAAKLGAMMNEDKKMFGAVGKAGDVRLLKPSTYMNRSGQAVAALANFFQVPAAQILVAHDELDLPAGEVKMKFGGGHAGHNGLRDIHAKLGSPDYWRLRIGIGHPRDSVNAQQPVVDWVLQKPRNDERSEIDKAIAHALSAWKSCADGLMNDAVKIIHTKRAT
jgi:peptidyl-tRNA hydrolase, PTH1 family